MFSNHNKIKLESDRRKKWETHKYVKIKQYTPN